MVAAPHVSIPGARCPYPLVHGSSLDLLCAADAALCKSGTTTLEAAVALCPMVVAYRVDAITYALAKRFIKIPYIGLVNVAPGPAGVQHARRGPGTDRGRPVLGTDPRSRRGADPRRAGDQSAVRADQRGQDHRARPGQRGRAGDDDPHGQGGARGSGPGRGRSYSLAGLKARTIAPPAVVAVTQGAALLALSGILLVRDTGFSPSFTGNGPLWSIAAGVSGAAELH